MRKRLSLYDDEESGEEQHYQMLRYSKYNQRAEEISENGSQKYAPDFFELELRQDIPKEMKNTSPLTVDTEFTNGSMSFRSPLTEENFFDEFFKGIYAFDSRNDDL